MKSAIVFLICLATYVQTTVLTELTVDFLKENMGKEITVEGVAVNAKLGALLFFKNGSIWIEGDHWPRDYYYGDTKGKTLRVTGEIIEKYDLPVFIQEPRKASDKSVGARGSAGIPVPPGTDLKKASHRYLLANASWEIISD